MTRSCNLLCGLARIIISTVNHFAVYLICQTAKSTGSGNFRRARFFLTLVIASVITVGCGRIEAPIIELRYEENQSLEHHEVIEAYDKLAGYYRQAAIFEMGITDVGRPLHLFMISGDGDFDPESLRQKGRTIVLVNNGIHAGEPAGIDASLEYAADILSNREDMAGVLDNTVIAIIPVYNIGGSLNRSRYYRMNQDGPEYKGARRNARNLDLNRDFVKMDSENARSFARIFHFLAPDVFVDTHTTNGADHQSVMTLVSTMHQKLPAGMGEFFNEKMVPELYRRMNQETPYGMVPYLQLVDRGDIRKGIAGFNDHPIYSTGYASLFNCFAFMTETLVYKPFPERVKATYEFIRFLVEFTSVNSAEINGIREEAAEYTRNKKEFVVDWRLDRQRYDRMPFWGYETEEGRGPVSGRRVTVYDHDRKWTDTIPFYNYFSPAVTITAPEAYIVPQAWGEVIERLAINGVEIEFFERDTVIMAETLYIDDFETGSQPGQGRHLVTVTGKRWEETLRQFYRGDAFIRVDQQANNYIVHMLEPLAPASFLRWGFFTSALEDGEFFWIWSFEDHAHELLQNDRAMREALEEREAGDPDFATDHAARLQFLYDLVAGQATERGVNLYPVGRVLN
jgi:hypothetical protein